MRGLIFIFSILLMVSNVARSAEEPKKLSLLKLLDRSGTQDVVFVPTPLVRQSRNFTCGAAAVQSILHFWGDEFREGQLARLLASDAEVGTPVKEILILIKKLNTLDSEERNKIFLTKAKDETDEVRASGDPAPMVAPVLYRSMTYLGLKDQSEIDHADVFSVDPNEFLTTNSMTMADLENHLRDGHPVIVLIQAWPDKAPEDWKTDWDDGHYVVVVGYDRKNIYFMDPSTTGNYSFIPRQEFMDRWHDWSEETANGRKYKFHLNHFGIVLFRPTAGFSFDLISKMK